MTIGRKALGCDPSYIALPLLAVAAAAIGTTRTIRIKQGWCEPAVLWTAMVGESGTLKSPALAAALQPLHERQAYEMQQFGERPQHHMSQRRVTSGAQGGGEDPPPAAHRRPPQPPRYVVSDTTVEALAPLLQANPRGLLLACDELSAWLGGMDRYQKRGADVPRWLSMHGARQLIVDRKHAKPIVVPHAAVSITGGVQPAVLGRALGRENFENGLAARLLMAMPPPRPRRWTDATIPPEVEAGYALIVEQLLELRGEPNAAVGVDDPVVVPLSSDAKARFIDFFEAHAKQTAELTGDLAAAYAKFEGAAARLALVLHLLRWAAGERVGDAIDRKTMESAVKLVQWHKNETIRIYAHLSKRPEQRQHRAVLEWLAGRGGPVTARDLSRGPRQYRGDVAAAERVLEQLANAGQVGRIYRDHGGGRGRHAVAYLMR